MKKPTMVATQDGEDVPVSSRIKNRNTCIASSSPHKIPGTKQAFRLRFQARRYVTHQ